MSNYTVTTNFGDKDSLPAGNSGKIIKGSEFTTEFNNIATMSATKADSASPTITGTLTTAALNVTGSAGDLAPTSISLADNAKIKLGTGNDLELYHNSTNSIVADVGAGNLELHGTNVVLKNSAGDATMATFTDTAVTMAGNVDLPTNGKLLLGDSDYLEIYSDNNNSYIKHTNGSGTLRMPTALFSVRNAADNKNMIRGVDGGTAELYHDGQKK